MANPTGQVPMGFGSYGNDGTQRYWPLNPNFTAANYYTGEMMGMDPALGYASHFDDTQVWVYLGNKIGDTHRLQSDTPPADFKEKVEWTRFVDMPLTAGAGTPAIPTNIGDPVYAANSGQVQLNTAGLTNNNLLGMVVTICNWATAGPALSAGTGINSLTGNGSPLAVRVAPIQPGALMGLLAQGIPGPGVAGAAAKTMQIIGGAGAPSIGSATVVGGIGSPIVITAGNGGNQSFLTGSVAGGVGGTITFTAGNGGNATGLSSTGNGGAGGSINFVAGAGGTSVGGTQGAAGTVNFTSGTGAAQTGGAAAGAGATSGLTGGTGGAGTATGTGASGGTVTVAGGTGGGTSGAGTGGAGGNLVLDAGAGGTTVGGTNGKAGYVALGDATTSSVYIGRGSLQAPIYGLTLTALTGSQNYTPTTAQLLSGILTATGQTAGGTVTLPLGATISAAMPRTPVVGDSFIIPFASITGEALTITGATGSTVVGTAAVPSGKNAILVFTNTGAGTWNCFVVVSA